MTHRTAILLFSRTHRHAEAGRYGPRPVGKALIRRAERTVRRSGLPAFRFTEHEQRGSTFGERLSHAAGMVFARGFDRLIIVGHDCPSLQTRHLRAAARQLQRGRNVLGPDRRGGSWLVGIQRADFAPRRFAALPWQTDRLYAALQAYLPAATQLVTQSDLHSIADIRTHALRLRTFLGNIPQLIDGITPVVVLSAGRGERWLRASRHRGPPLAA